MFHKILVAVNNTEIGQQVFEQALSLAIATKAELLLLNVISPFDDELSPYTPIDGVYINQPTQAMDIYLAEWDKLKAEGIEFLTLLTNRAIAKGVTADFTQELGDASRLICEIARSWNADLIILGRRGLNGLGEFFLGSVSNYVLHHAPCSVLTVQGIIPVTEDTPVAATVA